MPGDPRFTRVMRHLIELHDTKQADYGRTGDPFANVRASADFGIPGWVGAMVRANDKMRRIQSAAQGSTMRNESVADSLLDMAVYCAIAFVLLGEDDPSVWDAVGGDVAVKNPPDLDAPLVIRRTINPDATADFDMGGVLRKVRECASEAETFPGRIDIATGRPGSYVSGDAAELATELTAIADVLSSYLVDEAE